MTNVYEDYNQFRRLHPLTLLYGLIRNSPYIAITLYLGLVQRQTEEIIYILLFIVMGMIIIPGQILRWYYFSFMITEKEITIKSGILSRKQRVIPIERVQNVNVKQDILQRLFGIAKVQIETAGDISAEGSLEFVKLQDADEINRIIRVYQKRILTDDTKPVDTYEIIGKSKSETYNSTESGEELFRMTNKDVITYGMVRLRPLFLVYGIWAMSFITQFKYLNDLVFGYIDETIESFGDLPTEYMVGLALAFLLFSVLISWIVDIIWTFAQFYGFKLVRDGNKLFESYGLLSKVSATIPLKKLQQITISTNPVKKKFNFYTMALQTAGFDIYKKITQSGVPLAKKEVLMEIAKKIYPVLIPDEFKSISRKAIRRAFVRYLILMILPSVAIYYAFGWYVLIGLILIPAFYYAALLRWQYRGYYISDDLVFVKQGFWNQKLNIIPIEKIQTLHLTSTFFQRRLGLSSVLVDTASSFNISDAKIPDIDSEDAELILEELNRAFIESGRKK
ncbi:MAG: PH domain-containing protein [Candidatus Kapabacteria bacterium]|nr:PH domain-containing protein [Ignavibacteriota bacterium]MCW5885909.1 PH domain-containing protein [Candidatus Kapabacteria bacterium]